MKVIKIKQEESPKAEKLPLQISYFNSVNDVEVWLSFKQGDDTAFAYIYQKHISPLFNFGCQFSRNQELVKDCIQDMFIDLKLKRKTLSEVKSIRAYLYKCLHHRLINKLSKNAVFTHVGKKENLDPIIDIPIDGRIISNETVTFRVKWLQQQLNKLNKRQRQAILLYYYEGFSYEEVADILDTGSTDGARMLIKRGLSKLKASAKGNDQLFLSALTALILIGSI